MMYGFSPVEPATLIIRSAYVVPDVVVFPVVPVFVPDIIEPPGPALPGAVNVAAPAEVPGPAVSTSGAVTRLV